MANSINDFIKNNREAKDSKIPSKNITTPIPANQNQLNTQSKIADDSVKHPILLFRDTPMFNKVKQSCSKPLEPINESVDSPNSSTSSIDGELQICEKSNSSISSNEETIVENYSQTSTPVNSKMGMKTRSQTNLNNIPLSNIQNDSNKSKQ